MEVHFATIPPGFKLPNFLALSKAQICRGLLLFYHLPKGNVGIEKKAPSMKESMRAYGSTSRIYEW
jgi:hypothetical protein